MSNVSVTATAEVGTPVETVFRILRETDIDDGAV